jgi:hypothetical protein
VRGSQKSKFKSKNGENGKGKMENVKALNQGLAFHLTSIWQHNE